MNEHEGTHPEEVQPTAVPIRQFQINVESSMENMSHSVDYPCQHKVIREERNAKVIGQALLMLDKPNETNT